MVASVEVCGSFLGSCPPGLLSSSLVPQQFLPLGEERSGAALSLLIGFLVLWRLLPEDLGDLGSFQEVEGLKMLWSEQLSLLLELKLSGRVEPPPSGLCWLLQTGGTSQGSTFLQGSAPPPGPGGSAPPPPPGPGRSAPPPGPGGSAPPPPGLSRGVTQLLSVCVSSTTTQTDRLNQQKPQNEPDPTNQPEPWLRLQISILEDLIQQHFNKK